MRALLALMEVPVDRCLWRFHPGGLVCRQVRVCCHRGTEVPPPWWGGPVRQVVLDCPAAEGRQCPVAEAKQCRLQDGAEPVSRQVPGEGWGEMVELAWRCLRQDVGESLDGRDSRSGLECQGALAPLDGGQEEHLFLCERRSVVSGPVSDDQVPSFVEVRDVPELVSASEASVWLPRSVCWQLQV